MVAPRPLPPGTFRKGRPEQHGKRTEVLLAGRQRADSPPAVRRPSQEGTLTLGP